MDKTMLLADYYQTKLVLVQPDHKTGSSGICVFFFRIYLFETKLSGMGYLALEKQRD